jgi:hypothetical protein
MSPKMRLMRQYARNVAKSTADKKSLWMVTTDYAQMVGRVFV